MHWKVPSSNWRLGTSRTLGTKARHGALARDCYVQISLVVRGTGGAAEDSLQLATTKATTYGQSWQ